MKRQALVDSSARNVRPRVGHVRAQETATMAGEDRDAPPESTESLHNRVRQQRREIGRRRFFHINEENPLNYYARMIDVPAGSHSIDRRLGTTVGNHYLPPDITDAINAYTESDGGIGNDWYNSGNIQGLPQRIARAHPRSTGLRSPEGERLYNNMRREPFEGMFWMGVTDSPPRNHLRGPGGRRREERRLYNPLEDDDDD